MVVLTGLLIFPSFVLNCRWLIYTLIKFPEYLEKLRTMTDS